MSGFVRCVLLCVMVWSVGCASNHSSHSTSAPVTHVVVCWLKSPGDATARQELIAKSHEFQGKIPGLIQVYTGEPLPSTRPVVDTSYDVGIAMIFKDEASLRNYEKSPTHQKAVKETLQPLVAKSVIYDFADSEKTKGRPGGRPFTGVVPMP
jgi:hypothetical protein